MPQFLPTLDNTSCSQCGQEFGRGFTDYSMCIDHRGPAARAAAAQQAFAAYAVIIGNMEYCRLARVYLRERGLSDSPENLRNAFSEFELNKARNPGTTE